MVSFKTVKAYADGLANEAAEDGNWYYYLNDKVAEDFNGLAENARPSAYAFTVLKDTIPASERFPFSSSAYTATS